MSENRNREPFLTIRAITTRPELFEFSKGLRNVLASGDDARRIGWVLDMWAVLRELWAVMGQIGGSIPLRPALLDRDATIAVLRGVPESFYQESLRAVDDVVKWSENKDQFAETQPGAIVPPAEGNGGEGAGDVKKRRGRPRRTEARKTKQAEIASAWQRFWESKIWEGEEGTPKAQFCGTEGIEIEDLDTALRRAREQKSKPKSANNRSKVGGK